MSLYSYSYRYVSQSLRAQHREEHLLYMQRLVSDKKVLLAGPFASNDDALVILDAADAAEAQILIDGDPYALAGVVKERVLREWNVVLSRVPGY